jgi:hypothetical protein
MGWLLLAFVAAIVAAFLAGCLATAGNMPAPPPPDILQEPPAPRKGWVIVTGRGKSAKTWNFPVDNEGVAIGLFTQKGGNLAAITDSRPA